MTSARSGAGSQGASRRASCCSRLDSSSRRSPPSLRRTSLSAFASRARATSRQGSTPTCGSSTLATKTWSGASISSTRTRSARTRARGFVVGPSGRSTGRRSSFARHGDPQADLVRCLIERMLARRVRAGLVPALLLATTTALVAASGAVAYSEHAVVTLFVAPQRVHVENVAVASTPLVASVTESQEVTSSKVTIPASVASGRVTFMCSPMTLCPNGYTVAAGTVVESTQGVQYRTLSTVSFPSCAPSLPVAVTALYSGAAGNTSAGAVVYARVPGYIHVTNPWPITGGADARSLPVVQQSSVDAAIKSLMNKVSSELPARLQAEADGLGYVTTGAASYTTGGNYRVGDHAPVFTVQVTGTQSAIAFPAADARAHLRQALSR